MSKFCPCSDWRETIEKVNGPIVLQQIRSGGRTAYDGKPFEFCPWCGDELIEEYDCPIHGKLGESYCPRC